MERYTKKQTESDSQSDVNMSMPLEHSPESAPKKPLQEDGDLLKARPISAAVVRQPNIRIREMANVKNFKIRNLDEVNDYDNKNEYSDHVVEILQQPKGKYILFNQL